MYRIIFTSSAARELRKLSKPLRQRIGTAIDAIQDNPRPSGVRKLVGYQKLYRIRVGEYRVVYAIEDEIRVVRVTRVRHRREVYR